MKRLSVLALALLVPLAMQASQRVMVFEDITATWCTYCPGAARGIDELNFRTNDSVVAIAYHASNSGDAYYTADAATRGSYYSFSGYPTVIMDGSNQSVGGLHTGTMYPTYLNYYRTRIAVSSPLTIALSITYDTTARTGTVTIKMHNTSSGSVSGQLQTVLTESHIYYPWQGDDSLQFVERLMLPSASGEAVTIAAGDSLTKTRDFTVNAAWVAKNCDFIVFVQDNSSKEIYQGARVSVIDVPALAYYGYQSANPVPNGDANLTVGLRNMGSGLGQSIAATLSTSDSYITVTTPTANFANIAAGGVGYSSTPFQIHVSANCPNPHLATMNLAVTATGAAAANLSFPLNVTTTPGFTDNMESGVGGWTHGGIRDNWHQTTYNSYSPSTSWYCGLEGSYQYTNENDARLMTPFFTIGSDTTLKYFVYYELGSDNGVVEIDNGSGFWQSLIDYFGSSSGWYQEDIGLGAYSGQTVQLRFRFISDYSGTAEGWYIDNLEAGARLGVAEKPVTSGWRITPSASIVTTTARVNYEVPIGVTGNLSVYDVDGRLVQRLGGNLAGSGWVAWNLNNASGHAVKAGTYFVRLSSDRGGTTSKIVVTR
ncbi:MAG TPA: Omp28-related outer membrane protein [bacterium]|nr:Omp28-related outer membrane protein [bacterium]